MQNENQENNDQVKVKQRTEDEEQERQTSENLLADTRNDKSQKNIHDRSVAQNTVDSLFKNLFLFDFQPGDDTPNSILNQSAEITSSKVENQKLNESTEAQPKEPDQNDATVTTNATTDTLPNNQPSTEVFGKPNESIEFNHGDKKTTLVLDGEGKLKQFNDNNGDKIVRHADGSYYRESLIYPSGEKLEEFSVDPKTHAVTMTYKVPKDENHSEKGNDFVRRTIQPEGSETAEYDCTSKEKFQKADYSTKTTIEGSKKTVEVVRDNAPPQTLTFEKDSTTGCDKLVKFKAPNGDEYELNGDGKTWAYTSKDGTAVRSDIKVKADSNGAVRVDYTDANKKSMAERYLPNGTKVESDKHDPPKNRTINTSDGRKIEVSTNGVEMRIVYDEFFGLQEAPTGGWYLDSVTVTDKDGNKTTVTYDQEGNPKTLNGSVLKKVGENFVNENGETVDLNIQSTNGEPISLSSGKSAEDLRTGDNPFEHRALIQVMPENYEQLLKERLHYCRHFNYSISRIGTLAMFYTMTKDGAPWDDKQFGGQYQRWGNVAWGMYASETGMPASDGIWYNGAVKRWINQKSTNPEWGSPLDWTPADWFYDSNKNYGQNPADSDLIRLGFEQREKQRQLDNERRVEETKRREREVYQPLRPTFSPHPTY